MAFDCEQGGRLFRLLWVREVRMAQEKPKQTWVASWEQMREWETATACQVFSLLQEAILSDGDGSCDWDRERGGRLIRERWVQTVPLFAPDPNPSLLWPWEKMEEWEREADRVMFEYLRAALIPGQLARKSARTANWLATKAINDVYAIALAGPYAGDVGQRTVQKIASLQVAEQYALCVVEGMRKTKVPIDSFERAAYKRASEVGNALLAHIRLSLVNPALIGNSEQTAVLNGWYTQAGARNKSPMTPGMLTLFDRPRGYRNSRIRRYPLNERFWVAERYIPRLQGNGKRWAILLEERSDQYALYKEPEQAAAALDEWLAFQDELEK